MNREPVVSSYIESVGYDSASETLEIEFKGGAVFQYDLVSASLYHEFVSAPSPGSFFHRNIKDKFISRKI